METMKELEEMIDQLRQALCRAPEGSLKISHPHGKIEYCSYLPGNPPVTKCIRKNNPELAAALAQKDYNQRLLKLLEKKLAFQKRMIASCPQQSIDNVYLSLSPDRQALVKPIRLTDEQYIKAWLAQPYEGKGFRPNDNSRFYTKDNERMKSKSELLIANTLSEYQIPRKYECPLYLGNKILYPDFTTLRIRDRKIIYFEHFGMMDDPEYMKSFLWKKNFFEDHGIYIGENLVCTFESSDQPLDTRRLRRLIEHYYL